MALFAYAGRDRAGERIEGQIEAGSLEAVIDRLGDDGITPIEVVEAAPAQAPLLTRLRASLSRGTVRHVDLVLFCRQMYTLLKSGVPILRALGGLQESATNKTFGGVIREVRESLESGSELSRALEKQGSVFNRFFVAMVRVGESTGRLEEIFLRLFHHLEFQRYMREQVRSALRYPSFVVLAMAAALVIINIFVIPTFAKVFQGLGAELPAMTVLLLGFSGFMVAWWPAMLLGTVAAVVGVKLALRDAGLATAWDRAKLRLPIAGSIIHKASLARFARSLALGVRSGVPIVQALGLTAHVVENRWLTAQVEEMRRGVERGDSILRTAIKSGVFTPVVLQMVMVGEETGSLDEMLDEVADMYQREVEYELKTLSARIEPILIIGLGVIVLILALGVFLPMWDFGKAALHRGG
ncbi:MAG: type II secretion system F family protein [Rhodocyclaceae bacterium]